MINVALSWDGATCDASVYSDPLEVSKQETILRFISSLGLSTKDETVLRALVDLLGARTHESWAYSAPDEADVLLLDGDNANAVVVWESRYLGKNESTIVYSSSKASVPMPVRRHLTKPLRAADLIAHLNALNHAASPEAASAPAETELHSNDDTIPATSLPQTIFDTKKGFLTIALSDCALTLNRDERSCVMTGTLEQIVKELSARQGELPVSFTLHKPEALSATSVWLGDRSILWQLSLSMSNGKLLKQLGTNDALRLTRWPPPSLLKGSPELLNLCALLSRPSGVTFSEASQQLKLSDSELAGFINAVAICGMLVYDSAPQARGERPVAAGESEPTAKGLFARLRSRLGI